MATSRRLRSRLGLPFFGLTQRSEEDLFLEDIYQLMKVYPMSYWELYALPVPYRKWLIRRWNKEQKEKGSQDERPMSASERMKMQAQMNKQSQYTNNVNNLSGLNQPVRNKK